MKVCGGYSYLCSGIRAGLLQRNSAEKEKEAGQEDGRT